MEPRVLPTTNRNTYRALTEVGITSIVHDLVDSYVRYGVSQSRAVRESETARIARKRKVTNLQVGGIRSNLNRGAYGNVASLVATARKSKPRTKSVA